jgi:hypothetical protein
VSRGTACATAAGIAALAASLAAAVGTAARAGADASTVVVLLDKDGAYERAAPSLAAKGARVLADYGGFVLAEVPRGLGRAGVAAAGLRIRRELAEGVRLRRRVVGPPGTPGSPALRPSAMPAGGRDDVFVVKMAGPVRPGWTEEIRRLPGARILMPLPEAAYLVWLPHGAQEAVSGLGAPVAFAAPLAAADKVSPDLDGRVGPLDVTALFAATPGGEAAAAEAEARALGSPAAPPRLPGMIARVLTLAREDVEAIAEWPETVWIEPFDPPGTSDEIASLLTAGLVAAGRPLGARYREWIASRGFGGLSDIVVQVVDTGIDTGGTGAEHPALLGRLAFAIDETGEGSVEDCVGHGTHIAGIIAGDPPPEADLRDDEGFELGLGVAPGVRVGATRIFNCGGTFRTTRSFTESFAEAHALGARVSNNSWGSGGASYTALAREFDALVRDADGDPTNGDQPMVIVASAGNLGASGGLTVQNPSLAKNVISVGATESYRPTGTDGCGAGQSAADSADDIRPGSSRGPTVDGRIKPDLLAPGSHIISLASRSPRYSGLGLCDPYFPPGQRLYGQTDGTSQAAAHVSGAAALLLARAGAPGGAAPSPALVKARLAAAARDLGRPADQGASGVARRPSFEQGWGRVDVGAVVDERFEAVRDQVHVFTAPGQEKTEGPFVAADLSRPVVVALAWTDAPGAPAGSSWVNDLDLQVSAGGTTFLGNVLVDGRSVPGGSHDARNNLEVVHLDPPPAGAFEVKVTAVSVGGDGVPSRAGLTDQDFALYVRNAVDAASPGSILLDADAYRCGGTAGIVVADRHLAGAGSVRVEASSSTEPAPESVDLVEGPAGTGIFRGAVGIASGAPAGDGVVQVADGDALTVTYPDRDAGGGAPGAASASAAVACGALAITDLDVTPLGSDRALVSWRTSHAADSRVSGSFGADVAAPQPVVDHRVLLGGLHACDAYRIAVSSSDGSGASARYPPSGFVSFATGSGKRITFLSESFEGRPGGWTHSGRADEWELGIPLGGPGGAASGTRAWGTDLDGTYDDGADMALTSPPIDLRGRPGATLTIRHFLDIPPASGPGGAQDGAWIETTPDGGATWTPLVPTGGYPFPQGPNNPHLPAGTGVLAGVSAAWAGLTFDLSPFQGKVVRLRFRLWRDPGSTLSPRAGWYLDDLVVSAPVPCHRASLYLDAPAYGCSNAARVTLADSDLDVDPTLRESALVTASSGSSTLPVLLTETSASSGVFAGAIQLSPSPAAGRLAVSEGATVVVAYRDADDGTGTALDVAAEAAVPDCSPPPPPEDVVVRSEPAGRLRLEWTNPPAADLAEVRVHYDSDAPGPAYSGLGALQGASPVRAEAAAGTALLSGLPPCVPHFLALTAVDATGNESVYAAEVTGVPRGSSPCARAVLDVSPRDGAGCTQSLRLRIEDVNADPDAGRPGTLVATASSPSDPSPLEVTLTETGPATGAYEGTVPLSPQPAPGRLAVAEGDLVDVAYADADAGGGIPSIVRGRAPVDDCAAPAISDLEVSTLGFGRLGLAFRTDEPASSTIEYSVDGGGVQIVPDPALRTEHDRVIEGLPSCASLAYRVLAEDGRGNVAAADDGGSPFRAGTPRTLTLLFDDFESGAPGWTHGGALDEWELGAPAAGPPGAFSGTTVWGTDLDGNYEFGADMTLTSPEVDLTGVDSALLTFRHWYSIFTSNPGSGLDDGAWIEVSADGGVRWTHVEPEGGYPDRIAHNPYLPIAAGVYAGVTSSWTPAVFRLDAFAGSKIRVRFHLYQDVVDPDNSTRPGWFLDDVEVRAAVACRQGRLRLDASRHDCGGAPIAILLWDLDLDLDPTTPDAATVRLTSPSDPSPMDVALEETGPATGAFAGRAPISGAAAPGSLRVSEGDLVVAAYQDADDGTGAPAVATAATRIADCTPPVITDLHVRPTGPDAAIVAWTTDEPARSLVRLLAQGMVFSSTGLTTQHAVPITGLAPCAVQDFEVVSADAGGNVAAAGGGAAILGGLREILVLDEGFETGAPGWEHGGVHDEWEIGPPAVGPPGAFEGSAVAGTDLDGSYDKDLSRQSADSWLLSPPFTLAGSAAATLRIRHYFDFVPATQGDGAIVEAWDGRRWAPLAPPGGYPGRVRVDRSGSLAGAFTGKTAGWALSTFDLGAFAGRATRLRFRMHLDHGTPGSAPGWYLDQVRVAALVPCRRGTLLLDRGEASCGPADLGILLADSDLDLDPGTAGEVLVEARLGGRARSVALAETGPATGVFAGSIRIEPSPGGSGLAASEGDLLEVVYDDVDDGSGAGRTATAAARIADCGPPEVRNVAVEHFEGGPALLVRWETDEPARGSVVVTPAGSAPRRASTSDLATRHEILVTDLPECSPYTLAVGAADAVGNGAAAGGPAPPFAGETARRRILFRDDMEGPNPGWVSHGIWDEWQRGVPTAGPPGPLSGSAVLATDLAGFYQGGVDAVVISPAVDLSGTATARLTLWHFYDVFASGSPNADDDGAWVEALRTGGLPLYVQPVDGYSNTIDRDANPPLAPGSGVFAGNSVAYRRDVFDLSPLAGGPAQVRFRIWNDILEGIFNQATGYGWYLDDVEISAPDACFPPPALERAAAGRLVQGAVGVPLEVRGTGLREPFVLDAGAGLTLRAVSLPDPDRITALVDVGPRAAAGPRNLRLTAPDGRQALLPGGLRVEVAAARADLDGSGAVDGRDLAILARAFGSRSGDARYLPDADLDGDGAVDGADLAILGSQFGRAVAP